MGGRPWKGGTAPVVAVGKGDDWAHILPDGSATCNGTRVLTALTEAYTTLDDADWPGLHTFTLEADAESGAHCPSAPAHVLEWVIRYHPHPLPQQTRLCLSLTEKQIEYESPPDHAEDAWQWLATWARGTSQGPPPPDMVR